MFIRSLFTLKILNKMADTTPASNAPVPVQLKSPQCYASQHKRGKHFKSGEKQLIMNVYSYLRSAFPNKSHSTIAAKTARMCMVGEKSVVDARTVIRSGKKLVTPERRRVRNVTPVNVIVDDFMKTAVRQQVHRLFRKNEHFSLDKLLKTLNDDDSLPKMSRTTLYRCLKGTGFIYTKRGRNAMLIDSDEIAVWRHRYLRKIRHYRENGRNIIFVDETWINAGHVTPKVWVDKNICSARQALVEGLSTGYKNPSGKGGRLIILHAGSCKGFVLGAQLVFVAKKGTGDYHQEMDGQRFLKWFQEQLLPNIQPNSVIVMDNASYHSVQVNAAPTKSSLKAEMQEWLTSKQICWGQDMIKAELYDIISKHKEQQKRYIVDSLAEGNGHEVVRLPPYHCELNPIELIWAQIKGSVAKHNTTFKMGDIAGHFEQAVSAVTSENWSRCCDHVKVIEDEMWKMDMIQDEHGPLTIHLADSDSDEPDSDSDLGVQPLPDD